MPSGIEAIGVVIPARDQAETIAQCILSIFAANSYIGWRTSLWIVVVADACRDKTVKVARDTVGAFGEVLEVAAQPGGRARGIGTSTVLEHFHHKPRHAILLTNTDAGTCVRRDWIDIQLKRQRTYVRAADAMCGSPSSFVATCSSREGYARAYLRQCSK